MCVDAVMHLDQDLLDPRMIGVKKVMGGSMRESFLVDGVAFKKTFAYAGFEQQPKYFENPKVLALNLELELKSEKDNAEVRLSDPGKYQEIVDAEWNIIYDKLEKCVASGAKIILSRLAIGDLATQYFADRGVFCAGRVTEEDLLRVTKATGARVQTTVNDVTPDQLGTCEVFEERQVGNERFNLFRGCPGSKTCTMVLRGGAEQFIEEAARSLNDAIEIVRRAVKNAAIVPGGGAIDMELSRHRDHARGIAGKGQLFINAFAKALEMIPRQLCDNSGFDATDVLNKLRQKHALRGRRGGELRNRRQHRRHHRHVRGVHLGALAREDQRHRRGVRGDVPGALASTRRCATRGATGRTVSARRASGGPCGARARTRTRHASLTGAARGCRGEELGSRAEGERR